MCLCTSVVTHCGITRELCQVQDSEVHGAEEGGWQPNYAYMSRQVVWERVMVREACRLRSPLFCVVVGIWNLAHGRTEARARGSAVRRLEQDVPGDLEVRADGLPAVDECSVRQQWQFDRRSDADSSAEVRRLRHRASEGAV